MNTLISTEKPETIKEEEFLPEEEEDKTVRRGSKINELLPEKEDIERLFQAELQQMMNVNTFFNSHSKLFRRRKKTKNIQK